MIPPTQDDVVAFITVRLHAGGAVSVQGHLGDAAFAQRLLDHAKDAIGRQFPKGRLVIPGRDVDVSTDVPLREFGTMGKHERGDP